MQYIQDISLVIPYYILINILYLYFFYILYIYVFTVSIETELKTTNLKGSPSTTQAKTATKTTETTSAPTNSTTNNGAVLASTLSGALLSVVKPSIHQLSSRLLELQESQAILIDMIYNQKNEINFDNNEDWKEAKAILDRIPEYSMRLKRMQNTMNATHQLLAKIDKNSTILRNKIDEKDKERTAKKTQDTNEFQKVSQR